MTYLAETDQVAIYIGLDRALFVLSQSRACPRCGRNASIFQYRAGRTECVGCCTPETTREPGDMLLPVLANTGT